MYRKQNDDFESKNIINYGSSSKDIATKSFAHINSDVFIYFECLINYIEFLGAPVRSVNDYTTNLFCTLCDSVKALAKVVEVFFSGLIKDTHYHKIYTDQYYLTEKNNAEYIATVDKVISISYKKDKNNEEIKDTLDFIGNDLEENIKDPHQDIKFGLDMSLLQSEKIESIGSAQGPEAELNFLYHPRRTMEDHYLKTDITLVTLIAQLSVHLGDLVRDLKEF